MMKAPNIIPFFIVRAMRGDDLRGANKFRSQTVVGYWTFGVQKHVYVSHGTG